MYINHEINVQNLTLGSMSHVLTVGAFSAATPITRVAHWESVKGHNQCRFRSVSGDSIPSKALLLRLPSMPITS